MLEVNLNGHDLDSIRAHVESVMDGNSRKNLQDRAFFYPLALATYGVDEVMGALDSMTSFRTTMWSKTSQFEDRFAADFGSAEAVMVNSGSSSDLLIAFALREKEFGGLEVGDEVLAPAVTWPTQIWSLVMAGFSVKLVDVDHSTMNMSWADLESKIGPRTRAISLVHLMGNTPNMDKIMEIARKYDLVVIEDACEALGAKWRGQPVGTFGLASSSSFFFSHHITTMEGGMVATDSPVLAEHFRLLRAHGWTRNLRRSAELAPGLDARYSFASWGFNVRPTELNAAFGLVQLERFAGFQSQREKAANYCLERIKVLRGSLTPMSVQMETKCSWFAFPIMVDTEARFSRSDLVGHLEKSGVETRPIVAGNLAKQPATKKMKEIVSGHLPGADEVHNRGFYIGLHPIEFDSELERVWDVIEDFTQTPR